VAKVKKLTVRKLEKKDLSKRRIDDDPGWYIEDPNNPEYRWVGPYHTKAEAMDERRGLERFWRSNKSLLEEEEISGT
jgi:hypothetical protein